MFMCKFVSGGQSEKGLDQVHLILEDCPSNGLDAIDFREEQGLIAEPTNVVIVPGRVWRSEEFCREREAWLDNYADLDGLGWAGQQEEYTVDEDGIVREAPLRCLDAGFSQGRWPLASGTHIRAYLFNPTDETCASLWLNIWEIGKENRRRAEAQAAKIAAAKEEGRRKYQSACETLEAELAELAELRKQVALLRERIDFLTASPP